MQPAWFNAAAGLCVICPIASRVRDYPFEVNLPEGSGVHGVVLADQPRSISWETTTSPACRAGTDVVLTDVRECLAALLGID
ncbi:type II toxin-antitoxin system PemK/MazF family toxin [Bradyrhizobium sp. CB82]|uniref:type II toxin-antitoxin system PemK/MazF family toxin n=1 Tax=Bradyrhizobium sp. CB82 TaxID=3039159 RepID=UPI0024B1AB7F|nr:type II toxin-antitoxin system PemK/MazF family toxin [Bradyrhizobium sp. CB82]WFU44810.1 type II toxin-antitoxin system PemK/MazF family toxin [Bradyrhizobium sp. CB82]